MSQTKAQLISDLVQALNFTGTATAPANGLFLSASNQLKLATASTERLKIDGTELVVNDTGASVDFRVEGDTEANLLFVDASTDRVGVGTNSPLSALHVRGSGTTTLRVDNSDDGTASLTLGNTGSSNLSIAQTNANAAFSIGGSEKMRIASDGKVGIGTASPSELLHLKSTTVDVDLLIEATGTNKDARIRLNGHSGGLSQIQFGDQNDGNTGLLTYDHSDDSMQFRANDSERMRIDSSGRLLIGATSARSIANITCKTQIEATDGTAALSITRNDNAAAASTCRLNFGRTRATSLGGVTAVTTNDILGEIRFSGSDGTDLTNHAASIGAVVDGSVSSNTVPGRLVFNTATGSDPVERMRITSAGRVGIGNTSPQSEIHIGAANNTSHEAMIILNNGGATGQEAGIEWRYENITAPRAKIHVNSSDQILRFSTADNERMRIDSSGRLLIGTTTEGTVDSDDLTIATSGNTGMTIRSGTTSNGAIHFSDATSGAAEYAGYIDYDHNVDKFDMGSNGSRFLSADSNSVVTLGKANFGGSSGVIGYGNTGGIRKDAILALNASATVAGRGAGVSVGGTASALGSFYCNKAGNSDSDGGNVFLESVGALRFLTGGANDRAIIDSSGNVGIGTTSPSNELVINKSGSAANCKLEISQSGGGGGTSEILFSDAVSGRGRIFYDHGSNPEGLKFEAAGTQTLIVTTAGKVGIGRTDPPNKLRVEDSASGVIVAKQTTNNGGFNTFEGRDSSGNIKFYASHNGRVGASEGIIFGTDTATANVLDDYEEGTWNPDPDDGNNVFTHGQEQGRYIKIGHVVHCTFSINVSLSGTSGFAMFMTGLPFTVKDFSENTNEGLSTARGTGQAAQLEAQQGQTKFKYRNPSSGAAMSVNDVGCTNNTVKSLRGAITYITT